MAQLKAKCSVVALDALALAEQAGNKKAVNTVLLGIAAKIIGGEYAEWESAVLATVPAKFAEVNCKAFRMGYDYDNK
jgi:indolepyruvate ferredoxin oxidoreductase beta subunit